MKRLINRLKYWLFRQLMDELCVKSRDCKTCPINHDPNNERDVELAAVGGRLFDYACGQTDVYIQAYQVWMLDGETDTQEDCGE